MSEDINKSVWISHEVSEEQEGEGRAGGGVGEGGLGEGGWRRGRGRKRCCLPAGKEGNGGKQERNLIT